MGLTYVRTYGGGGGQTTTNPIMGKENKNNKYVIDVEAIPLYLYIYIPPYTCRGMDHLFHNGVEDTYGKNNRLSVHIQSVGEYDSVGATCHRERDKKCTAGDI